MATRDFDSREMWTVFKVMAEFVEGFLDALEETRQGMRESLRQGQLERVGESAHRLKGTAGYLGAIDLVQVLAEIQQRCRAGGPAHRVEPLLARVDELRDTVRMRLQPLAGE